MNEVELVKEVVQAGIGFVVVIAAAWGIIRISILTINRLFDLFKSFSASLKELAVVITGFNQTLQDVVQSDDKLVAEMMRQRGVMVTVQGGVKEGLLLIRSLEEDTEIRHKEQTKMLETIRGEVQGTAMTGKQILEHIVTLAADARSQKEILDNYYQKQMTTMQEYHALQMARIDSTIKSIEDVGTDLASKIDERNVVVVSGHETPESNGNGSSDPLAGESHITIETTSSSHLSDGENAMNTKGE